MKQAVHCFSKHIQSKSHIHIVVDSDVDGYVSAASIYKYIEDLDFKGCLTYSIHTGKQHGISNDIKIPDECKLLIVPDAGTNDIEQCQNLKQKGIDVLILDHHEIEKENPYAIVVNNQSGSYPNKNLCGAGIVYKFLLAVDDELWCNHAEKYIDLVALANISDNMDLREYETRYYVNYGLKHVQNKLFIQLIKKMSYSIKHEINITNIQFYITPLINALIRMGGQNEKELMFQAFLEKNQEFEYQKYNSDEIIQENIYERVARLCLNAKNRQTNEVKKELEACKQIIENMGTNKNKVIFVNATNKVRNTLTGLIAMKIADSYMKPCLVLRRTVMGNTVIYKGSGRNFDHSPLEDFKGYLNSLGLFEFVQGHANAFGSAIVNKNIPIAINKINEELREIDFQKQYQVDFDFDSKWLHVGFIKEIYDMRDIFCQGIKEPLIAIRNVTITRNDISFIGKTKSTVKYIDFETGIAFMKFNCDPNEELVTKINNENGEIVGRINIVGRATLNIFNSIITPQIIIDDYEFIE